MYVCMQVCKSNDMGECTKIEISGSEEENQVAKKLIDELVGNISGDFVVHMYVRMYMLYTQYVSQYHYVQYYALRTYVAVVSG